MDEEIAGWPAISRLAYIFMWMEADDCGRLRANSSYLASVLFPYERKLNMEVVLQPLKDARKLVVWEVGGQTFGILPNFLIHQKIDRPNYRTKIPDPSPEVIDSIVEHLASHHGLSDEDSTKIQRLLVTSRARALEQGAGSREQGAHTEVGEQSLVPDEAHRILAEAFPSFTFENDVIARQSAPGLDYLAVARECVRVAVNEVNGVKNPFTFWRSFLVRARFEKEKKETVRNDYEPPRAPYVPLAERGDEE